MKGNSPDVIDSGGKRDCWANAAATSAWTDDLMVSRMESNEEVSDRAGRFGGGINGAPDEPLEGDRDGPGSVDGIAAGVTTRGGWLWSDIGVDTGVTEGSVDGINADTDDTVVTAVAGTAGVDGVVDNDTTDDPDPRPKKSRLTDSSPTSGGTDDALWELRRVRVRRPRRPLIFLSWRQH